MGKLEGS